MPGEKFWGIVKENRNTPSIKYTKTFSDFFDSFVMLFWENFIWDRNKIWGKFFRDRNIIPNQSFPHIHISTIWDLFIWKYVYL